jgi:hypothetical protein
MNEIKIRPKADIMMPDLMSSPLINTPVIERNINVLPEENYQKQFQSTAPEKQIQPEQQQQHQHQQQPKNENNQSNKNIQEDAFDEDSRLRQMTFQQEEKSSEETDENADKETEEEIEDKTDPKTVGFSDIGSKVFGDTIIDGSAYYVPIFINEFTKIDINSARIFVAKGLLAPEFLETFEKCNANNFEALKLTPEEIKMLKKAFKEYLKIKQFTFANEENAFWAQLGMVGLRLGITAMKQSRENKKIILETLRLTNPEIFKPTQKEYNEAKNNIINQEIKNEQEEKKGSFKFSKKS